MNDHLQTMTPAVRRVGAIVAGVGALLCGAIAAAFVLMLLPGYDKRPELVTVALVVAIFGTLALYCSCLTWRLATSRGAANGITVMPPWTIQVFGAFLACGGVAAAFAHKSIPLGIDTLAIAGAMLLVGRNIAARQRRRLRTSTDSETGRAP